VLGIAYAASAHAQGAPFAIRRPPDGATVREQVRVEIPGPSVGAADVVEILIDGKFVVALPAVGGSGAGPSGAPFTFVWDTKGGDVAGQEVPDGEHTLKAMLYTPVGGSDGYTVKAESEVKVTVQNKIKTDPGPIRLQYHFHDGDSIRYSRVGRAFIVAVLSGMSSSGDRVLASVDSQLQLAVEDVRADSSLVRNRLTRLDVEENGQERSFDPRELPDSIYEELDTEGRVVYAPSGSMQTEFDELGLAVESTLDLPVLPSQPVSVGSTWTQTEHIDVPGTPAASRPAVSIANKFEDLEWDNGYPTAKIKQTLEGTAPIPVQFGPVEVTGPKISFERDIYLAYRSGRLIRTVETLTVSGETTAILEQPSTGVPRAGAAGALAGPVGPPPASGPGRFGRGGLMAGRPGAGGAGGMVGQTGGRRFGMGAAGGGPGAMGRPLAGGTTGGAAGARGTVGGNLPVGESAHPVVLKSTMVTTLIPESVTEPVKAHRSR
jgi:hypothetical protein